MSETKNTKNEVEKCINFYHRNVKWFTKRLLKTFLISKWFTLRYFKKLFTNIS